MNAALKTSSRESQLTQWFSEYGNRLLRFVRSRINNRTEAEDIAQDIWYQLTLQEDIDQIEQIGSWLFSAAKNRVVNFYKKKKSVAFSDLEKADTEDPYSGESMEVSFDQWANENMPGEFIQSTEFMRLLDNALNTLPEEQRDVFIAHEMQDISFKELTEKTGIPLNTLLARKRYAVLKLREYFKTYQQ